MLADDIGADAERARWNDITVVILVLVIAVASAVFGARMAERNRTRWTGEHSAASRW